MREVLGKRVLTVILFALGGCCLHAEKVRVATLNLNNYLSTDRMVEGGYRPDYPKPEAEKEALREVIRAVNPDVLAVQEVGKLPFLKELQRDLLAEEIDYPYVALMEGSDPDRHTAVLSKVPFKEVIRKDDLEFNYFEGREQVKRGLLGVVFATAGKEWTLYNLHLKSRWTDRADDPESRIRREKESLAIRNYLKKEHPPGSGEHYLVAGDLNDTRSSKTLRQLLKSGDNILTEMIPASDSRGETWTYYYGKEDVYSRVDYILLSPALAVWAEKGGGRIVDSPEMSQASDHRLVYLDLFIE